MRYPENQRKSRSCVILVATVLVSMALLSGCSNDALDPTQIGRFRPVPVVNVILDSLGVADEPNPVYAGAEDPLPQDIIEYDQDYVFGTGDIVRISIYELRQGGVPFVNDYIVTETGNISIPDVGVIRASGLTEVELEQEIKNILSPTILLDPSVTVTLIQSQSKLFSIYGNGVGRPGRYEIPRKNFRLSEAVALAGGVAEFNVTYIYITRHISGEERTFEQTVIPAERTIEPSAPQAPERTPEKPVSNQPAKAEPKPQAQDEAIKEINPEAAEIKTISPEDQAPETEESPDQTPAVNPEDEMLEMIAPYVKNTSSQAPIIYTSEMASYDTPARGDGSLDTLALLQAAEMDGARIEWQFQDGKWVPVKVGEGATAPESAPAAPQETQPQEQAQRTLPDQAVPLGERLPSGFGWEDIGTGGVQTRVIRIPVDSLVSGDPRYDIILKSGDSISVPVDLIGEFWVMGNVNAQGPITLTGRPMTLKMAIASAGGLGPLAWPSKVEVIRRIGRNKEEIVMVDLEKIAKGQQPDFFIKPYDLINVGTHGISRWLAVLRNAFRAEYGFGFTYSRNFAVEDFGNRIGPKWEWSDITDIF